MIVLCHHWRTVLLIGQPGRRCLECGQIVHAGQPPGPGTYTIFPSERGYDA